MRERLLVAGILACMEQYGLGVAQRDVRALPVAELQHLALYCRKWVEVECEEARYRRRLQK